MVGLVFMMRSGVVAEGMAARSTPGKFFGGSCESMDCALAFT
jgi:hypothetical protein